MPLKKTVVVTVLPQQKVVLVRKYDEEGDRVNVEDLDRRCEEGHPGEPTIIKDIMGDPIANIRHSTSHIMLVAEHGEGGELVGVIRGCVKTVTNGKTMLKTEFPVYVKLAYILGLRVNSTHRRLGIATKLVQELEKWCNQNGAEYAYMATECDNHASLNLFTKKCNYQKFRNPTMLVQPVHLHYKPISPKIKIIRVSQEFATVIYRRIFSNSELFPEDINSLLDNKLNLGTFIAIPKEFVPNLKIGDLPSSFAILSIWDTKKLFWLKMKGVSALKHAICLGTRVLDAMVPWLKIPSIPNVFKDFGFYFLFGLHMEGEDGSHLMKSLCKFAHNMGRDDADCELLVAEVGQMDPVRESIPHWKRFSWDEDAWCVKKLGEANDSNNCDEDWIEFHAASPVVFVDPREL